MSVSNDALLAFDGLRVTLPEGSDRALGVDSASLELARDEIVCLVGESGSGKSLMARAAMRLLPGDRLRASGNIRFEGRNLLELAEPEMRRLRGAEIAMIFQEPMTALNPLMRIGAQIDEMLVLHTTLPRRARASRIASILDEVHLADPERVMRAYPHELSGGQRQRAMIAMALVLEPKVLLADEPTTALDVTTQARVLKLIRELQSRHRTAVLFITHDFGVVAEIADRVAVMHRGCVVERGSAVEVLTRPSHAYTRALLAAVPALDPAPARNLSDRAVVLAGTGLSKSYARPGSLPWTRRSNRIVAVDGVDFQLRQGETLGIVGESGSGKSTLARMIVRLVEADAGSIELDGQDVSVTTRRLKAFRSRVQIVFQDPFGSLNPRARVGDIVACGLIVQGVPRPKALERARAMLALVGLDERVLDRFPHQFSGGQRQRIAIARALAVDPQVLVADEPVSALDVSVQAQVLDLLATLRTKLELAMLFITHDLRVAAQVCDRVAVMHRGHVVETGTVVDVFSAPRHPYTQELLASVPGRRGPRPAEARG